MSQSKLLLGTGLVAVLIILGAADGLLTEGRIPIKDPIEEPPVVIDTEIPAMEEKEPTVTETPSSTKPPGVKKWSGPDTLTLLSEQGFEVQESQELTILSQVLPEGETLNAHALLRKNDRAGFIAWVESPKVKQYFLTVKEALHESFSPDVRDLVDELKSQKGKPPHNFLTFFDSSLSLERIVFIRVRERLYEFHIAEGKDDLIFGLIDLLTR